MPFKSNKLWNKGRLKWFKVCIRALLDIKSSPKSGKFSKSIRTVWKRDISLPRHKTFNTFKFSSFFVVVVCLFGLVFQKNPEFSNTSQLRTFDTKYRSKFSPVWQNLSSKFWCLVLSDQETDMPSPVEL